MGSLIEDMAMQIAQAKAMMARQLAEIERLQADNERMRNTLELIAGQSTQKLEAMQAKAALTNIGPKISA